MTNNLTATINRAAVMLTPPHQDEKQRRASRAEAVAILRSSLGHLMQGDCPDVAERVLNLALDVDQKR